MISIIKSGLSVLNSPSNPTRILHETSKILQARHFAARKGTRERKRKNKVKVEIKKVGFIPHNLRDKDKQSLNRESKKFDDSWKQDATDNVFVMKYYKWINYPFVEAVQAHRETHHPSMYNQPTANVHVTIELNMQTAKKNKMMENFSRIAAIPHKFDLGEDRTIIAFAKNEEDHKTATNAGAHLAGGLELIKQIQNSQVLLQDFQFILAHPNILTELVALRGLMKKRFPNHIVGTLDANLPPLIEKYLNGVSYKAIKDEHEKDFGQINAVIGTLNMDPKQLEDNFKAVINDVYSVKPKREGDFIRRCLLTSPPSPELLKIDHTPYLTHVEGKAKQEEEEEVGEVVAL